MTYARILDERNTPQSEPLPGKNMVQNNAGGYVYKLDQWGYLERFLVLGTESPTYYASARKLTVDAAKNVQACIRGDGKRTVDTVVAVSKGGFAPSNDPALFVLAMCMSAKYADPKTRVYAEEKLNDVARTGTHIFTFLEELKAMRGYGRIAKRAITNWYLDKDIDRLAYQMVKYKNRAGWNHKRALQLGHPNPPSTAYNALFNYAINGIGNLTPEEVDALPDIVNASEAAHRIANDSGAVSKIANLIRDFRLTHEMIPNSVKKSPEIWGALLEDMPTTAMIRNLGVMTANGLVAPGSNATRTIVERLSNQEILNKARVHPILILNALNTYRTGQGGRGSLSWTPVNAVTSELEDAFYKAFATVEPSGKSILLALDVSGSMASIISGMSISAREACAVMAMVSVRAEKFVETMAFSHNFVKFPISRNDSLQSVSNKMARTPFGGTDCSLPMIWARNTRQKFDTIVVYTDNETWAGRSHPVVELNAYRQSSGLPTRLIVVGFTATNFSIADPSDPYSLDVVGFDTRAPKVISDFSR